MTEDNYNGDRADNGHPATERVDAARRTLLKGFGAAAVTCPFAGAGLSAAQAKAPDTRPHVTDAPVANMASADDRVPFHGLHQPGVTTPRPANGMIASFDVMADTPDELETLFRRLTERIAFLSVGGKVPEQNPRLPPLDSGIVGPVIKPDALTITVSLGASLFNERAWLKPLKPLRLSRMTRFTNDALDSTICHGDLSLQICANTQDTTIHALRDIIKTIPGQLILKWKQEGNVPVITPGPDGSVESARNFLGFRDGSANPDSNESGLDEKVGVDRRGTQRAGLGAPRQLSGGAHHPQFCRALGPHTPAGAGDDHGAGQNVRRAAGRAR